MDSIQTKGTENGAFHLLEGSEEAQAPGGIILAWGTAPFQDIGSPSPPRKHLYELSLSSKGVYVPPLLLDVLCP